MPSYAIVDTHLHIWDPGHLRYSWLEAVPLLNKPYLIGDYRRACSPIEVEKMVFVQAEVNSSQFLEEADWVVEVSRQDSGIRGIVAWAPLERGDAAAADLEKLSSNPLVKGIRRIIQFEPDPEFCLLPDFVKGVQLLADYGFTFDICISHKQMANTIKMIERCPEVTFILDHVGKPDIKSRVMDPWRAHLKRISEFPNVWCKMSGLVTEADHQDWKREQLRPYIDHVLECFGFDRTMYGGDWPVACQATDYPRWVETLEWAVTAASESEQRKLFRENATEFYRLG